MAVEVSERTDELRGSELAHHHFHCILLDKEQHTHIPGMKQ